MVEQPQKRTTSPKAAKRSKPAKETPETEENAGGKILRDDELVIDTSEQIEIVTSFD